MLEKKVKVLIVDDSILFRETISRFISEDANIEVVGTAGDPYEARDKILQLRPDVLTLDVEMPKMNGIQFLKKLIPQYPIPVVVVSSLPLNAFEALDAGAVDFVKKPLIKSPADLKDFSMELRTKIVIASTAKIIQSKPSAAASQKPLPSIKEIAAGKKLAQDIVIALGASTGGTDALQVVMQNLPKDSPPILVVQHMPAGFTKMYAERMNRVCQVEVKEAEDGDRLRPGLAIIAAGEYHLRLAKDSQGYYVTSKKGEKVSGHCPSVDVLFYSVAEVAKSKAIGAILTGMGGDGAKGLLEMRKAGAYTIGQNKETCVVYGMPMVAFNIGAVCEQAPLDKISDIIIQKLNSL
ncbi:MAG: two-component system, chemotaxis family, protein-glutamate methylesterase/glutaminase [Clostridiales bacterium]|jgi:two-component system chemotaxis response regulator CheB|nr:cheB [Oscillospiraceae bacterium]MDN5378655.1 two-component system, chemotaxis family, protein-glutamate methylesterase/glutaminase [Clostridiales bacterium]